MSTPTLAVGAVCLQAERLLLIERANEPGAGLWSLPGGRVDEGETLAQALRREVREETGLHVEVGPLCGIAERIGTNFHFVILDFWIDCTGGEQTAIAGDDAAGVMWADATQLRHLTLVEHLYEWLDAHGVLARLG